jgi:vacuolar-type H+-ATPase subunit E/Vma4
VALDELLRTLETEAGERVAALQARARAEADQIRATRAGESARRRAVTLEAREAELRRGLARDLEAAERDARRQVLEARADVLQRIRRCAEQLLAERAADPESLRAQAPDLERALEYLGESAAVVEAPAGLVASLQARLDGRGRAEPQPAGARPGLTNRSADGGLTVDATPGGRLAREWGRLSIELAARLEARP